MPFSEEARILFGILLSPVGAIVFVEHWLFPRIGFQQYWFTATGKSFSWPALAAWVIAVTSALLMWYVEFLHMFFIAVPVWFLSAGLYLVFAAVAGAKMLSPVIEESPTSGSLDPPPTVHITQAKPAWLRCIGMVALLSLGVAIVLPLWVLIAGVDHYQQRLEPYYLWLGIMSVVHLICIACWGLVGERIGGKEAA